MYTNKKNLFQIHVRHCLKSYNYFFYHSSFPWPFKFLQSTYIYFIIIHCLHQFVHFACSVQCEFVSICYPQLINPFPVPRSIPLSLQGRNSCFFLRWETVTLSPCRSTPNLERQSTVFLTPAAGWPTYTPRQCVLILVAFYDLNGLQWDHSSPYHHTGTFSLRSW